MHSRLSVRPSDVDSGSTTPLKPMTITSNEVLDDFKQELSHMDIRISKIEHGVQETPWKESAQDVMKYVDTVQKKLELKILNLEEQLRQQSVQIEEIFKKTQKKEILTDGASANLFKQAKTLYQKKSYERALELMGQYLQSHKNLSNASEAIFIQAQCFYHLKQYRKAILEYSKVCERYSKSPLVPEALFRTGISFDALKLHDDAKEFYSELIKKYPKSPLVKAAKKAIEE
jgi:TolA-binding protein